ncbi:ArnT family glycosyltransferase [Allomuricauda sp. SCSIO 65647]|uniref:ArnT family glycosyltransferase n=1 Tax=Allomuricauda sp. SCSIO 65647 TaxID=2908843 RepID=UPI001F1DBCA4|nr:glycosyltransferase family 39 protein [Muricauda sp. SCSIO 65647]UJH66122.1 glycosyltransferase family 39 protein [Muricauda sp. SCSIO 65647]
MLKKVALFFIPEYSKIKEKVIFFWLLGISVFVRFPFFFRDYIDRDESTFIIMGQSWVDGHLPYTELWDLKPPIIFLVFAAVIHVFGKSFVAIRLLGAFFVALTAFFTYKIGSKMVTKRIAFWVAILAVVFQSLFGSLQGFMSEHICIAFFVMGLYLFLFKNNWYWVLLSGTLFGLSFMSKLNMAYPLLFLGVYLVWEAFRDNTIKEQLPKWSLLLTGGCMVIFLTALLYVLSGEPTLWWQSVFRAPMAYSSTKIDSVLKAFTFLILLMALCAWGYKKQLLDIKKREVAMLMLIIFGIAFSFVQTGKVNGHYLIQLYPFLLILIGMALSKITWAKRFNHVPAIFIISLLVPMESYLEYANIIQNKIHKGSFFNGEGIDIPKYIVDEGLETDNIFFAEYHIGYWVLGVTPPTKVATHPSNITRETLFPYMQSPRKSSAGELRYIMEEIRPSIIVARNKKRVFDKQFIELNFYINLYLCRHYRLLETIDKGLIYERLE